MKTAMLWYDADPKTSLQAKVVRAADYYRHKYGQVPNECHVHPKMMQEATEIQIGVITVKSDSSILPGHLWIGMKEIEND